MVISFLRASPVARSLPLLCYLKRCLITGTKVWKKHYINSQPIKKSVSCVKSPFAVFIFDLNSANGAIKRNTWLLRVKMWYFFQHVSLKSYGRLLMDFCWLKNTYTRLMVGGCGNVTPLAQCYRINGSGVLLWKCTTLIGTSESCDKKSCVYCIKVESSR